MYKFGNQFCYGSNTTIVNKKKFIYFSGSQQPIISFFKIKNLIKNLVSLNC